MKVNLPSTHIIIRLLFFFPSIIFALFWFHVVSNGLAVEDAMKHDIRSPLFLKPMNHALDDPWLHNSTLRRYFQKLGGTPVAPQVWANSEWLAYALWNQIQFGGGVEIMIVIAHNQNMPQKELPWAKRYVTIFPDDPLGADWIDHAQQGHDQNIPLHISGRW